MESQKTEVLRKTERNTQLIPIIPRFCVDKSVCSLKLIFNPEMNTHISIVTHQHAQSAKKFELLNRDDPS